MALGGAILAGGMSTRMGEPKHALRLADGRTMLECVAGSLRRVCDVLAIVGLRDPRLAHGVREMFPNAALIHDSRAGVRLGPLAGIEALLQSNLAPAYIVCSCDTPLLSPEIMEALAAPCEEDTAVLHLAGETERRPLPCRVNAGSLQTVTSLLDADTRAVHELHRVVEAKVVHAPASWAHALLDINTPSDLDAVNAQLASNQAHPPQDGPEIVTFPRKSERERRSP